MFAAVLATATAQRRLRTGAPSPWQTPWPCTLMPEQIWSSDPNCYCRETAEKVQINPSSGYIGWMCYDKNPTTDPREIYYNNIPFRKGEVCYQFYEDGSKPFIDHGLCVVGYRCMPRDPYSNSFRASVWTCQRYKRPVCEKFVCAPGFFLEGADVNGCGGRCQKLVADKQFHGAIGAASAWGFSSNFKPISDATLGHIWNVPKSSIPSSVIKDLNDCLQTFEITTKERMRHFLSQTAHESGGGRWTKELSNGYYLEGRSDLGNVYPGDGPRFKGAGYLQLTGRVNYEKLARYTGDNRVMEGVDYVASKYPFTSAGVWWKENNMNSLIDSGASVTTVTRRVNGGTNGLADREMYYRRTKDVI